MRPRDLDRGASSLRTYEPHGGFILLIYNESMETRIKANDYQLTPNVSDYIDERMRAIERLLGSDSGHARAELTVGRASGKSRHGDYMWFAEIDVRAPGGIHAHASNHEDTVNAAVDRAKEEILTQLRKGKQFHRRWIRKTGSAIKGLMRSESDE